MKNRELKFRAWNGMEMVYDVTVGRFGSFYVNPESGNGLDPKDSASLSPCTTKYPDSVPIMQFTGYIDKNEKEIYEGDILEAHQTINGQSKFVIVDCIGEFDLRYAYDLNRKYEYSIKSFLEIDEIEIIGNIHNDAGLLAVAP